MVLFSFVVTLFIKKLVMYFQGNFVMRPNKYNPNVDMVVRLSVTYDDLSKRKGSKVKFDHINILYDA